MSWAAQRRFLILLIVGAVVTAFITILGVVTFYEAPSCSDGIQNQGEGGIDCSGPCPYACTADVQAPAVLFTKAINSGTGRTDVVALVENKNGTVAAKNVPYRISAYGSGQVLLQEVTGTIDLPPSTVVPVFAAGVTTGKQPVVNVFLTIEREVPRWYQFDSTSRTVPQVSGTKPAGTLESPRIQATLTNPSPFPLSNIPVVVLVRDTNKEVVAASRTLVQTIAPQSSATAVFTWNTPFSAIPASIDVIPIVPLP